VAEALLNSSTYIDLERAGRHRREVWAANTIQNALEYRTRYGKPAMSIITVVDILKGLHRDVIPDKGLMFKQVVAPNFNFLDVTTEIGYLASEIIAKLEDTRQAIGFSGQCDRGYGHPAWPHVDNCKSQTFPTDR
jgi:predicted nucleic acid-binding protein